MRQSRVSRILFAAAAYVVIGASTAALAKAAPSSAAVRDWRLAGWLLSLSVFITHFFAERARHQRSVIRALNVALAVALGALVLAALGPVRTHLGQQSALKAVLLSLIAWPLSAGIPAFVAALVGDALLHALAGRKTAS